MRRVRLLALLCVGSFACSGSTPTTSTDASTDGATTDASQTDAHADGDAASDTGAPSDSATDGFVMPEGGIVKPCTLPGSVQYTSSGTTIVPGPAGGGDDSTALAAWLHLPAGFCAHPYGNVGNTRTVKFAPNGDLFVASPTGLTTGGGPGGLAAIVILPDDNKDGYADAPITFLSGLPNTQGMLFANDHFYFQNGTQIQRIPYTPGDRKPSTTTGETVIDVQVYISSLHWPKAIDMADDGTIYVANGGDQDEVCDTTRPFHGGILKIDGTSGGAQVAKGFRNPIEVRCAHGHDKCFALELSKDYSASVGGREKMAPIRQGDDWGFPCCATKNLPYPGITPAPDCSGTVDESDSFLIGDTPFGLDFEAYGWPAPWSGRAIVANHGAAGTWLGARVLAIAMDPSTGLPVSGADVDADTSTGGMMDFATGWDDGTLKHGRPATVSFSPDGRLFVGSDTTGMIFWIAPM